MRWPRPALPIAVLAVLTACVPPRRAPSAWVPPGTSPPAPTPSTLDRSPHLALGTPHDADDSDDLLLDRSVYVTSYNPRKNVANWVSWALDARDLGPESRNDHFHADDALPTGVYRVKPADYAKTGFDRGHLCPSADRTRTPEENALTFLMSNMHPQAPELNRGDWKKLEEHERTLAKQGHEVFVVAGGVFGASPRTIGHGVAVPDAEYKILVVLDKGQGAADVTEQTSVIAVVMPNDASVKDHRWTDYVVTVDEVERQTGYDFLPRVPEAIQQVIEARRATPPR